MIRMVKGRQALGESDVVGKYVLRDQGYHWAALGKPVVVTSISGSRAYVEEERGSWNEEDKRWYLTGEGDRHPAGHINLSTVRCICDTAEEVNTVIETSRLADREFRELLDKAISRLAALDGTTAVPTNKGP